MLSLLKLLYQTFWLFANARHLRRLTWRQIKYEWPVSHELSRSQAYQGIGFAILEVPFKKVEVPTRGFIIESKSAKSGRNYKRITELENLPESLTLDSLKRVQELKQIYEQPAHLGGLPMPAGILHPRVIKITDGAHRAVAQYLMQRKSTPGDGVMKVILVLPK